MKSLSLLKPVTLALACAALAATTLPIKAAHPNSPAHRPQAVQAYAGTTFTLVPVKFDPVSGQPTEFSHIVDGVVRVSLLGNCTVHADVTAVPHPDGSFTGAGTIRITSADGATTLDTEGVAVVTPDPDPNTHGLFGNFHYDLKVTGGTGQMAHVVGGKAEIDGFAMFTPELGPGTGKATWVLKGCVATRSHQKDASCEDED